MACGGCGHRYSKPAARPVITNAGSTVPLKRVVPYNPQAPAVNYLQLAMRKLQLKGRNK